MKIICLLFLSFIGIATYQPKAFCQAQYFNNTIDLADEWGMGMSVIANDSTYHLAGLAGPGHNIALIELGLSGDTNWIKKYGKPGEAWYPGNPGSLKHCNNGYVLGGAIVSNDTTYGHFIKFNQFFDTIITNRFSNPIDDYLVITNGYQCFDDGFVFTGDVSRLIGSPDILLLKTDSIGNELWRNTINLGGYDRGWSIIQTPDSGYVVGGYTYIPGQESTGDPFVVKFDKNGNYSWKKIFGGEYKDDKAMICMNNDSTFTVLTKFTDSMYTSEVGYSRINLIKISQTGNIIWNRKYGSPLLAIYVSNIKNTGNEGYICCGARQIPDTAYDAGWLFRFKPNGDSLWFRDYMYYSQYPGNINQLWDVDLAPDGGFIATGQAMAYPPNDLQKIWILKVDSIGCDTAGCDPTVGVEEEEETGGNGEKGTGGQGEKERLVIWPNPAAEGLSVKVLGLSEGNKSSTFNLQLSLDIYDIFGRTALSPDLLVPKSPSQQGGGQSWQVDVSALPPGIYIAVARYDRAIIGMAKFVVAR